MKRVLQIIGVVVLLVVGIIAGVYLTANNQKKQVEKPLLIGLVPAQDASSINSIMNPIEKVLSKQLGQKVEFKVMTDYTAIVEALGSHQIDAGFLPPEAYVQAHKQYGSKIILQSERYVLKDGVATKKLSNGYHSFLLVKKDSPINSIKDLSDKTIATQGPTSSSGYIFPIAGLYKDGVNVFKNGDKLLQVAGHDQGVLSVLNGSVDAAFVYEDARLLVQKDVPSVFNDTKVIWQSELIPNDTVTVDSKMTKSQRDKLATAIEKAYQSKTWQKAWAAYGIAAYGPGKDSNFKPVRENVKIVEKISGE
jgi:phosphonate transport system substrate-binding protein